MRVLGIWIGFAILLSPAVALSQQASESPESEATPGTPEPTTAAEDRVVSPVESGIPSPPAAKPEAVDQTSGGAVTLSVPLVAKPEVVAAPLGATATPSGPTRASRESWPNFLQAPTSLTADTTGQGEAKAGLGYGFAPSPHLHLSGILVGRVATSDGLSRLFGASEDGVSGPPDWSVGLSLNLAGLFERTDSDRAEDARLYSAALVLCHQTGTPDFKDLCPAGKRLFADKPTPNAPKYMVSLGGRYGVKDLEYLVDADADGDYASDKRAAENYAVGASGYTTALPLFVEGMLGFQSGFKPSTTTVEYCSAVGTVAGAPAEQCKKGLLGAPTLSQDFIAVLGAGVVDPNVSTWRAGFRFSVGVPAVESSATAADVGFGIPFYVRFANLESTFKYKGILSVTPRIDVSIPKDGSPSVAALVNLAVLGQRDLFSAEFDKL